MTKTFYKFSISISEIEIQKAYNKSVHDKKDIPIEKFIPIYFSVLVHDYSNFKIEKVAEALD